MSCCYWSRGTVRWHWSADTLFDSCQLTITWISIRMSTIKLNTDCIYLGHLASSVSARSLQENSQSECAYYCSHIITPHKLLQWRRASTALKIAKLSMQENFIMTSAYALRGGGGGRLRGGSGILSKHLWIGCNGLKFSFCCVFILFYLFSKSWHQWWQKRQRQ